MKKVLIAVIIAGIIVGASVGSYFLLFAPKDDTGKTGGKLGEQTYNEAPELAALAASGQLPPVNERLPKNPMLILPEEKVGKYGGTWQMATKGTRDHAILIRSLGYENLVRWDADWTRVIPNIAQTFESNADATEYTFHLREGMRWSDGALFSADDIMFWYEDVLKNPQLTTSPPTWLIVNGQTVMVEKIDNLTVVFKFAAPYGLFPQMMAKAFGVEPTAYPKHYLSQFHEKYNTVNLQTLIQQANVTTWTQLFVKKFGTVGSVDYTNRWQHPELPTLNAWILTTVYGEANETHATRNPYYWKVDPAGNQLPYINAIVYYQVESNEQAGALALAGKVDMQDRHILALNRAMFETNATAAGIQLFDTLPSSMNQMIISLNLNHYNATKRAIFANKDFRIGLSYAIDRQYFIDTFYNGNGIPYQASPRPESPLYNEQLATQYTEFNGTLANQYLDSAGYTQRDSENYRLGPDSQRIHINFTIWNNQPQVEFIKQCWEAVGIEVEINFVARDEYYYQKDNNLHDAVIGLGEGGMDPMLDPRFYFPFYEESPYAELWQYWYNDKPLGEEPPQIVKTQMDLYDQVKASPDSTTQEILMTQLLEISADQFYVIGLSLTGEGFGIMRTTMHNVPKIMPYSWTYPTPAPTNPCQYYIE